MLREFARKIANLYMMTGDNAAFARRKTRFDQSRGRQRSVQWDAKKSLFLVRDNSGSVYVARKQRVRLQNMGVAARRARLIHEYLGRGDLLREGDVVIDCGANIGEFSVACAAEGADVHSFEPDPKEYAALCANSPPNVHPVNKALWCRSETLTLYDNNSSGDSSVIDSGSAESVLEIDAIKLDDYVREVGLDQIRLIKVEAEGAEPEVLDGAREILSRTEFVAVDMGPERGMAQQNTVVAVMERLTPFGFQLVYFDNQRFCGLFASKHVPKNTQ